MTTQPAGSWLERTRDLVVDALHPPLRDPRFWVVQGSVVLVSVIHEAVDLGRILEPFGVPEIAPLALFLVPVMYAAFNFGLTGSFATAAWMTLLTLPDILLSHQGSGGWADLVQVLIIDAVAVVVGQRVEQEQAARRRAEVARQALVASEVRYRALFESNHAPILVLDTDSAVKQANPAAARLFPGQPLEGMRLADLVGRDQAAGLLDEEPPQEISIGDSAFRQTFRPLRAFIEQVDDGPLMQLVLQDVTEERMRERQAGIYASHVLQGQEEERRRLAQEIHDEPVQELIHLCRVLDTVALQEDLPPASLTAIVAARRLAEATATNLRELSRGLRPPSLDDLGLVASLRHLATEFKTRSGMWARLRVVGEPRRLASAVELGLFRIAQEALHNAERHSGARRVWLEIGFDAAVTLDVRDDGVGFHRTGSGVGERMGLRGIRERASLMGADLAIDSRPGRGTRLRVRVPVPGGTGEATSSPTALGSSNRQER